MAGTGGAAANTAAAYLNVTAVDGAANSYLTTWPDGQPRPATSTVNFPPGAVVPSLTAAGVGADGKVDIYNHAGSVDVLADLFGYFVPA